MSRALHSSHDAAWRPIALAGRRRRREPVRRVTSVERQAIAGLKWIGGAKLVAQLCSWAITLVVVRLLAPGDYGLMALATVVWSRRCSRCGRCSAS